MRAATVVQVLQDLFYVLLIVLFYLWSLLKSRFCVIRTRVIITDTTFIYLSFPVRVGGLIVKVRVLAISSSSAVAAASLFNKADWQNATIQSYSVAYMSQTRKWQRFTMSEVAADWYELMHTAAYYRPSIALDRHRHYTAPVNHTRSSRLTPQTVGGWVGLSTVDYQIETPPVVCLFYSVYIYRVVQLKWSQLTFRPIILRFDELNKILW